MELKTLKTVKHDLKKIRKESIRDLTRSGVLSSFGASNSFLVSSVNELWDLVCDVSSRKIDEAIKVEANRMMEEAKEVL